MNKLSEVKSPEGKKWVVDFSKLYKAWENKRVCATLTMID